MVLISTLPTPIVFKNISYFSVRVYARYVKRFNQYLDTHVQLNCVKNVRLCSKVDVHHTLSDADVRTKLEFQNYRIQENIYMQCDGLNVCIIKYK